MQTFGCKHASNRYPPLVTRDPAALGSPVELFTRQMFTHIIEKLSAFLARSDFTISEVAALHVIDGGDGISVQALSARLNLSVSATSRLVSRLVEKGLVLRREDASDGRARVLTCSKAGKRLLDQMSLERMSAIFEVAATLPPEASRQILQVVSRLKR